MVYGEEGVIHRMLVLSERWRVQRESIEIAETGDEESSDNHV